MTAIHQIDGGTITSPQGFLAGAAYCGLKTAAPGQRDLGILFSTVPAQAAGLFTQNKVKAAPVFLCQEHLKDGWVRAVVINSGCSNSCTGEQGQADAQEMAALAARKLGVDPREALVASTGVIGVHLDMDKIRRGIAEVQLSPEGGQELPQAIMTTDTRRKEIAVALEIGGRQVTVAGIAKGAGMIHPNMATMLGFIATDAALEPDFMRRALRRAADVSFNMISIDGDTSTNDTLILLANGLAGNPPIRAGTRAAAAFQGALNQVCRHLAKTIARDGEGATKLFEITVNGARTPAQAGLIARTVTTSYLVKSAIHGGDPNWGRILAAAGRSGAEVAESKVDLFLEDLPLMLKGRPISENRAPAAELLAQEEVRFRLELYLGRGSATAWGCDLSEEYVTFNSAYTT